VVVSNTVALITVCSCISAQVHASFESQRLMKGIRSRDSHSIPSIFAKKSAHRNRTQSRIKKHHQSVQPLKMANVGTYQLADAADSSQVEDVYDEKSSRQTVQQLPSSSPSSSNTNKATNRKQRSPVTSSTTFTVAPVASPVVDKTTTSNAPVRAPTILSFPITLPTNPPTVKPVVSVPLSVATTSTPTTFFVATSNAPTATITKSPTTAQPTPVLIISPISAPIDGNITTINGTYIALGNEQSDAVTDNETGIALHSSSKATTGTIIGVVLAVIVSMIVSVTVLMTRHKYIQKHGAASTRRRRNKAQQKVTETSGVNIVDSELHNVKTVHIITSNDNDIANESPDRTYEILLEDDDDNENAHLYSQESSFISTSGGEEMESDLDRNVTTQHDTTTATTRKPYVE
jgi:hypothetical protein